MSSTVPLSGGALLRPRATCYQCFKPAIACICAALIRVENQTGIIILQHPRERFHPVGTERIARLGLTKIRVEQLAPWTDASAVRARIPEGTYLLYPAPGARDLATLAGEETPQHLLVLDGTWVQAKKIYDAHPWLTDLAHVGLTPAQPSGYRIRRQPKEGYVATIEAIVQALRILEPQTSGLDGLLRSFAAMVDRQAAFQLPPHEYAGRPVSA